MIVVNTIPIREIRIVLTMPTQNAYPWTSVGLYRKPSEMGKPAVFLRKLKLILKPHALRLTCRLLSNHNIPAAIITRNTTWPITRKTRTSRQKGTECEEDTFLLNTYSFPVQGIEYSLLENRLYSLVENSIATRGSKSAHPVSKAR
jgi:hypothetical protein